jgi:hypothetical protein
MEKTKVYFDFRQKKLESGLYAVEKDLGDGQKHRYLEGIASGIYVDGHGERMTPHCIESFQSQAKSGTIPLFSGKHGVDFADDIGILVDAKILDSGEWWTSFRLYDESDKMGPATLEKADKVWRQSMGIAPYTKPKNRGFSIEGDIPEGGIKSVDEMGRRVMDDVKLEGVVLVERPAYQASVAYGVYKALGVMAPWSVRKSLQSSLESKMQAAGAREEYWKKYYQLQDALDSEIKRIMADSVEPENELSDLFVEYSKVAVSLILEYPQMYKDETDEVSPDQSVQKNQSRSVSVLKDLESNLRLLLEVKKSQKGNQL